MPDDLTTALAAADAQGDDDDLVAWLVAAGAGLAVLVLLGAGTRELLQVNLPEDWPWMPEQLRWRMAREAIAEAPRTTLTYDDLAAARDALDARYRDEARRHGEALVAGEITVEQYRELMLGTITEAHTAQRGLAQGQLSQEAQDSLQRTIDEQSGYLDAMVAAIALGLLTGPQILDRSGRYGANGGLSFNEGLAATLPGVEEQRFLGNCTPHCPECVEYAARGRVMAGTLPLPRQQCSCRGNCCCTLTRYDLLGSVVGWIG